MFRLESAATFSNVCIIFIISVKTAAERHTTLRVNELLVYYSVYTCRFIDASMARVIYCLQGATSSDDWLHVLEGTLVD